MEELKCIDCDWLCNQKCQGILGRKIRVKYVPFIGEVKNNFVTQIVGFYPDERSKYVISITADLLANIGISGMEHLLEKTTVVSDITRIVAKNTQTYCWFVFEENVEFVS